MLSGGERRLLDISRALVMEPEVLLVDEPSIGLEPRFIDMVFEILDDLQRTEGKTILMVEHNAKKGLEFADIGYVLVSGSTALAGEGKELLDNPEVGRLFLGGLSKSCRLTTTERLGYRHGGLREGPAFTLNTSVVARPRSVRPMIFPRIGRRPLCRSCPEPCPTARPEAPGR